MAVDQEDVGYLNKVSAGILLPFIVFGMACSLAWAAGAAVLPLAFDASDAVMMPDGSLRLPATCAGFGAGALAAMVVGAVACRHAEALDTLLSDACYLAECALMVPCLLVQVIQLASPVPGGVQGACAAAAAVAAVALSAQYAEIVSGLWGYLFKRHCAGAVLGSAVVLVFVLSMDVPHRVVAFGASGAFSVWAVRYVNRYILIGARKRPEGYRITESGAVRLVQFVLVGASTGLAACGVAVSPGALDAPMALAASLLVGAFAASVEPAIAKGYLPSAAVQNIAFPVLAVAALTALFAPSAASRYAYMLALATMAFVVLSYWVGSAALASGRDVPPAPLLFTTQALVGIGVLAGGVAACTATALAGAGALSVAAFCLAAALVVTQITKPGAAEVIEDRAELGLPLYHNHFDRLIDVVSAEIGLSEREKQVLNLIGRGRNAAYVADELFVSINTAKAHIAHIYRKAGVNTRQELIDFINSFDV